MTTAKTPNLAACYVPWTSGGELDEPALRRHIRFLVKRNIGLALGALNTGEGLLLEPHEVRRMYEIGVEEAKGKVPIMAVRLGYTATAVVIKAAKEAASIGVDGVQIYPPRPGPVEFTPTMQELETFYRDVLEAVKTPVFLGLQSGGMADKTFPLDLLDKLVKTYPHIVGLNCTTLNNVQVRAVAQTFGARLPVRVGGVGQVLISLEAGGVGCYGTEPNIVPTLINEIVAAYHRGDTAMAKENVARVQRLSAVLRQFPVRSGKAAVHLLGRMGPYMRKPYLPLGSGEMSIIAAVLDELGIRQTESGD